MENSKQRRISPKTLKPKFDVRNIGKIIEFQPPTIKDAFSAVQTIQHFFTINQNFKEIQTDFALHIWNLENKKITKTDQNDSFFC